MPDLTSRAEFEKQIAAAVGDRLNGAFKKLMSYLDPEHPGMDNVPASFWEELGADLTKDIQPKLQKVFEASAQILSDGLDVEITKVIDWTMVNKRAAEWAKKYSFDLIKDLKENTLKMVSGSITDFFEKQLTIGDLRDLLEKSFNPVRAAMIASTEVTRASVQGELGAVNLIEAESQIKMVATYQTEADEFVCDECGPLDGQEVDETQYPPLHPNCRCFLAWTPEGWDE